MIILIAPTFFVQVYSQKSKSLVQWNRNKSFSKTAIVALNYSLVEIKKKNIHLFAFSLLVRQIFYTNKFFDFLLFFFVKMDTFYRPNAWCEHVETFTWRKKFPKNRTKSDPIEQNTAKVYEDSVRLIFQVAVRCRKWQSHNCQ